MKPGGQVTDMGRGHRASAPASAQRAEVSAQASHHRLEAAQGRLGVRSWEPPPPHGWGAGATVCRATMQTATYVLVSFSK